jgi:hypothetical protein
LNGRQKNIFNLTEIAALHRIAAFVFDRPTLTRVDRHIEDALTTALQPPRHLDRVARRKEVRPAFVDAIATAEAQHPPA